MRERRRTRRAARVAVGACAVLGVLCGPAQAAELTRPAPSFDYAYVADPGEANDMRLDSMDPVAAVPSYMRIYDSAGIRTSLASCDAKLLLTVLCQMAYAEGGLSPHAHYDRIAFSLGDGDDKIRHHYTWHDTGGQCLTAGSCGLHLFTIDAGPGNDFIDVADGVESGTPWRGGAVSIASCGAGFDVVLRDGSLEPVPADCELVLP